MTDFLPTCLSHIILAASSGWSLKELGGDINFGSASLLLYFATGVAGAAVYGVPHNGLMAYKVYSSLWICSLAFGLPLISSQLYDENNFRTFIILLHFIPPSIFFACTLLIRTTKFYFLEIMQAIYLLAICYISFLTSSYYGFALVTSYTISFYCIGTTGTVQNMPTKDLLSFSLVFSNYFTVRTLKGL